MDIPIENAMLCWNRGEDAEVILHPDRTRLSDRYTTSTGACFTAWRNKSAEGQKLQLMIDAWHATAFYEVPVEKVHQALLVIPEYRSMLADDCLPERYRSERD